MTSRMVERRVWMAVLTVTFVLLGGASGFGLALVTRSAPSQLVSARGSGAAPEVSRVVDSPGVSDCHPMPAGELLSLGRYSFGMVAAFPVAIDLTLHVWGPKCVISAGVVKPAGFGAAPGAPEWSAPPWDESRAGPGSAELLDVPGLSDCHPGVRQGPWGDSAAGGPFVAVVGRDGTLWGPRCFLSSGVAAS
jgi:hypothetical protein